MKTVIKRRQVGILAGLGASALLTALASPAGAVDSGRDLMEIDPKKFSRPTIIDNKWFPLKPGTQLIYDGSTIDEGKRIPHRIIFTVTDMVKVINGIPAVVVLDLDFTKGKLEEQELTFFAQDDEGNVWHLGQIREAYEDDEFIGLQAWMVGHLRGAKAGIMMKANPREGTPSYSQGFAPAPFNWDDRGQVRKLGEKTTVPAGTYENVLLVEEFNQSEPGAIQLKYYAQGVGNVRVGWEGNDARKETLELVKVVQLGPDEMADARAEVMKLEERAYVYAGTQPAAKAQ